MTSTPIDMRAELPCHRCGYDVRAQPEDGICPECGASVAESRRVAAIPLRPAWRDSDPRWRRRVLAGVWLLALLPLMNTLTATGLASRIPVPNLYDTRGAIYTLDHTLLGNEGVYVPVVFCMGVVLLFAKERGRRRGKWDWTRRWGVVCCYVSLMLSATQFLYYCALVLTGITAVFLSIPPRFQPPVTQLFAEVSSTYLRYGPDPRDASAVVLVASSSIAVLLACVALFDALRCSGPRRPAMVLLSPLALLALGYLMMAVLYFIAFSGRPASWFYRVGVFFSPATFVQRIAGAPYFPTAPGLDDVIVEVVKWCAVAAVAAWLTVAQLAAWRGTPRDKTERGD